LGVSIATIGQRGKRCVRKNFVGLSPALPTNIIQFVIIYLGQFCCETRLTFYYVKELLNIGIYFVIWLELITFALRNKSLNKLHYEEFITYR